MTLKPRALRIAALLPIALWAGCLHQTGPEDPSPVPVPTLVSVTVQYTQPTTCQNTTSPCSGGVLFWASWIQNGQAVQLIQTPGTYVWTGTLSNVPVNFPPVGEPYLARVYDPYLIDTPTAGNTAERLKIGGQVVSQFYQYGTPYESGLIYVDAVGVGHNPL